VDNLENISENEFKQKVNIYPNPAHNNINISLNYQSSFATNISIFALDGNLVYQSSAPAQTTSKTVELTNFKSGTYLMQIANGNKIHHQKIVVMP
jgi:hypothetical protein